MLHPLLAVLAAFSALSGRLRSGLALLCILQLAAGAVNVLLLAPVWMQLLHLGLAALIWTGLVYAALEQRTQS